MRRDCMYSDGMSWALKWRGMLPVVKKSAACEACGEPFACELSASGCWCSDVKLSDATRAEIKAQYTHCLCPSCLRGYAERQAHGTPSPGAF